MGSGERDEGATDRRRCLPFSYLDPNRRIAIDHFVRSRDAKPGLSLDPSLLLLALEFRLGFTALCPLDLQIGQPFLQLFPRAIALSTAAAAAPLSLREGGLERAIGDLGEPCRFLS